MAPATTWVYVANAESNEISVLRLDRARGDLTAVATVPVPGVEQPGQSMPMAVSPDRRYLYVATRGEPRRAVGFAIDGATGSLTYVASGPFQPVTNGTTTGTTFTDTTVVDGTSYRYRVVAFSAGGKDSVPSGNAIITTPWRAVASSTIGHSSAIRAGRSTITV